MRLPWDHEPAPEPLKGIAAGLLGGLAGSVAMQVFQTCVTHLTREKHHQRDLRDRPTQNWAHPGAPAYLHELETQRRARESQKREPATVKSAEALSQALRHRRIPNLYRSYAVEVVHLGFGTTLGGAYGLMAEYWPETTWAQGTAFGAGVMLTGDEIAAPGLGLAPPPQEVPASAHLYAFCSHLVYGVTCELVRQGVRRML
ncbi:MAG: DUF1440 domain-containing protein [Candidatus Hydrogenedentes bacterium]|nr:DUF1440 domain-containing protein [Candidatus Hydrogenedentota bacterium]